MIAMKIFFALLEDYTHWLYTGWPAGLVEKFPEVNQDGTTKIQGIRITGDLTGVPLLKFAADSGAKAVQEILDEQDFKDRGRSGSDILDLAIIGAGISGIAAAIEAKKAGLNFKVFEARRPFSTILDFPKGKPIHTYPTEMKLVGDFQVSADVKEALVAEIEEQRQQHGIEVVASRVDHLERKGNNVVLFFGDSESRAEALRVIIAIGKSGNFRKLGCSGEELDKVFNRLHDPEESSGKKVLIVGGGDSAMESAIALAEKGAYCGWVCSCGVLAETMGDTQRAKMPHGPFWNKLNMTGQVILCIVTLLLMIRIGGWVWPESWMGRSFLFILEGRNSQGQLVNPFSYKWIVDVFLGGIVGVSLYFKYSGRIWCRFACPLAALMHIYARFSRFRIFPDKTKCISCNLCTGTCHQGIDIMNFANKGLPMEDQECVRCSACVLICPTGVLTFGRYTGNGEIKYGNLAASPVRMREKHD